MTTSGTRGRGGSTGSGVLFAGILMIGIAVGIVTGQVAVAVLGALGVGNFVMAFTRPMRGTRSAGGLALAGCLFVGIALGLLLGNGAVGALAGLGCGLILMYLVQRSAPSD